LIDQGLQLAPRFGTILHYGTNPVEKIQSLVDVALRIGGVGTLLRRHGATGNSSVAGVNVAVCVAFAIAAATGCIADWTSEAVADLASSAGLTSLLPGLAAVLSVLPLLLTGLTGLLPGLTGLPVTAELAGLELLTARLIRGLAGAAGLTSTEARELVAQTG